VTMLAVVESHLSSPPARMRAFALRSAYSERAGVQGEG
jgi:hypothetical protein